MAPTATREEAEASVSGSRARKRRLRSRSAGPGPTQSIEVGGEGMSAKHHRRGMRRPTGISLFRSARWFHLSKKRKRSRADDTGLEDGRRTKKRNAGEELAVASASAPAEEAEVVPASASTAAEQEEAAASASTPAGEAAASASTAAGEGTSVAASGSTAAEETAVVAPSAAAEEAAVVVVASASTPAEQEEAVAAVSTAASEEEKDREEMGVALVSTAEEEAVAAASASTVAEEEATAAATTAALGSTPAASTSNAPVDYALNSPIRMPVIQEQHDPILTIDPAIDTFTVENQICSRRTDDHMKLPTMDVYSPSSCLHKKEFLLVRESATRTLLQGAKFVLGVSSFIDGNLLKQCSGFMIDWKEDEKAAIVLTSAHLICSKSLSYDEWLGEQVYSPQAEVYVLFLNGRIKGELVYYHKHYGFALISVPMERPAQLASMSSEVNFAQLVYALGRDENFNLRISDGRVQYEGPTLYEHNHYMIIDGPILKCGLGGPVINSTGEVIGMANLSTHMGFIPWFVIVKCLHLLKKLKCVPRLHLGLKFSAIMFLDLLHIEKISRECNVETGLIIDEVSAGSNAEKLGIRIGDILTSANGECIANTVELEMMLLRICEDHFDKGNGIGSNVDITVGMFYTSKHIPGIIKLAANVSDDVEVITRGEYIVSAREGPSASISDEEDSGAHSVSASEGLSTSISDEEDDSGASSP